MAYLELRNLTANFSGFIAVDEVNMKIDKGELRVIIGSNGAGKTTIIDMITGKTKPTSGAVLLEGNVISGNDPYVISSKYKIARKFQGPNVFDNMTVYENIEVALNIDKKWYQTFFYKRTTEVKEKIETILKQINLFDKKDMYTTSLSHGERQWLEIGMVLAQDSDVVTLDEPTAGMTADETYKTGELIKTIMKGKTMVAKMMYSTGQNLIFKRPQLYFLTTTRASNSNTGTLTTN